MHLGACAKAQGFNIILVLCLTLNKLVVIEDNIAMSKCCASDLLYYVFNVSMRLALLKLYGIHDAFQSHPYKISTLLSRHSRYLNRFRFARPQHYCQAIMPQCSIVLQSTLSSGARLALGQTEASLSAERYIRTIFKKQPHTFCSAVPNLGQWFQGSNDYRPDVPRFTISP